MATKKKSSTSGLDAEIKVFVPNETEVTTVHGDIVIVPKITWKKEIQLIKLIENVLESVTDLIDDKEEPSLAVLIQRVLSVAPEKATAFVSVVLEKDDEWVESNLDLPEIVGVIIPLLKQRLDMVTTRVTPYMTSEGAMAATVQSLEAAAKGKLN